MSPFVLGKYQRLRSGPHVHSVGDQALEKRGGHVFVVERHDVDVVGEKAKQFSVAVVTNDAGGEFRRLTIRFRPERRCQDREIPRLEIIILCELTAPDDTGLACSHPPA